MSVSRPTLLRGTSPMAPATIALTPPIEMAAAEPQSRAELESLLVSKLEAEANARVGRRNGFELNWMDDLRQYHGEYDSVTNKSLTDAKGAKSKVFVNITRSKVNALAARLGDMLFPTDEKNWGIKSTPVPQLVEGAEKAIKAVTGAVTEANSALAVGDAAAAEAIVQNAAPLVAAAAQARLEVEEATKRAGLMEKLCEDQLIQCDYQIDCRKAIMQACQIGTGVMKGPFLSGKYKNRWTYRPGNADTPPLRVLERVNDSSPAYRWVDLWSWFPDMDASDHAAGNGCFERHLLTEKQVRDLQFQPGFLKDNLRLALTDGPKNGAPQYLTDLRNINGADNVVTLDGTKFFTVWEFTGPITATEMRDVLAALGKPDAALEYGDADPLQAIYACVWFCNGRLLKFSEYALDSDESIYSTFRIEKDETSAFGVGIPRLMRHSQRVLNAAWRMMMDNSGLSVGPQVFMDQNYIEPSDGSWELAPRKVWLLKRPLAPGAKAFETFNVESNQTELANIINLALRFVDEETGITVLAQGEQGSHVTQTAQGMTILMNSVNVIFRRIIKCWDDDMTVPNLRRLYDWNMQFHHDDAVKGDFNVDARGSSVLLVREVQSQSLMQWVMNLSALPHIAPLLKMAPLVRKAAQAQLIPDTEVVKSDDEIARDAAEKAANPPIDIEIEKLKAMVKVAEINAQRDLQVEQMRRETEMMRLAAQHNMKLDELKVKLGIEEMKVEHKDRVIAAEIAMQQRTGASAGGSI